MVPSQEKQQSNNSSRREFIQTSAGVVAASAFVTQSGVAKTVHKNGSDVIRVGVIGCGGRGTGAIDNLLSIDDKQIKIVAMGDAFRGRLDSCYKKTQRKHADRLDVPEERKFAGLDAYQKVLATDCDLVILATPPGFRPIHVDAAVAAGKHVFMEKPVAVDAPGIRKVLAAGKAAKEKGLGIGVGLQRRHAPGYLECVKRIQDGMIGDVILSRVYWNGGGVWVRTRADFAKAYGHEPNELEYQVNNWYYFNWLCGDHIAEQHIHNLDVSNWVRDMVPATARGMGGREVRNGPDHGQIFDHHVVEFTYPDGTTMLSQCRHQKGCWNSVHEDFHGTYGTAHLQGANGKVVNSTGYEYTHKGKRQNPYVLEHADLIASIRAGKPNNEAEYGATSTMTAILGRMATYSGKLIEWDKAINSEIELAPSELLSWDAPPPVVPDAEGRYPIPVPGKTVVV